MSIVSEAPNFLQVYSDGSVERFYPEIAHASSEPSRGFISKDIIIDPSKLISARLFIPIENHRILPVIVYFHGGGFCIGSTSWLGYHVFLGDLSVKSKSIVLSVDYRLAPENKLPIAYDDCFNAIQWLAQNIYTEPWLLNRADISHVFLSGDSAGANIAHQVAIKVVKDNKSGVKILGVLSIHPYFGSEKRTEKEMEKGAEGEVESNDMFWGLSLPKGSNRDFYGCNFEKEEISMDEWAQFPSVVVYVAGLDFLKERGYMYAEFLRKKGVKGVKLVEAEGEKHVYHVFYPESEPTRLLQEQMSDFIHSF